MVPSIHEVAHEQVFHIRDFAWHSEELKQIIKLAVNISADGDGRRERSHIAFFNQYFFGPFTESPEISLRKYLFAFFNGFNPLVDVLEVAHSFY